MGWSIVTDSSCDLFPHKVNEENIKMSSVPFIINIGDNEYIDDEKIDVEAFVEDMVTSTKATGTACASPDRWKEEFSKAAKTIAVTISSNLSGSFNSASIGKTMALEEDETKKIAIIDSKSAGPELIICVEKVIELIKNGVHFDEIVKQAEKCVEDTHVVFALHSFENLRKNGRISSVKCLFAKMMNLWGIGIGTDEGKITIKDKARGEKKALESIITDMKSNGFNGGKVVISHCINRELAEKMKEKLLETWENIEIEIYKTRGLCSYYVEKGGIIVAYA